MSTIDKIFKITAYIKYLDFMNTPIELNIEHTDPCYWKLKETVAHLRISKDRLFEYTRKQQVEQVDKHWHSKFYWEKPGTVSRWDTNLIDAIYKWLENDYWNILPKWDKLTDQMLKIMLLTN